MDLRGEGWTVLTGSCLDRLKELDAESVDAVVTDPPYELGFMGKKWDSSGIAFDPAVWSECLRVLKPGGHILAFGGSRTWHRIAVAIEDAGFEIRDSVAWLYGSGFPKSLDVSKAIDKGTGENRARQLEFVEWMRASGLKAGQINDIIGKADVGSHYLRFDQPAIATADLFDKLRPYLPEVPERIERLVAERTGIEWTAYQNRRVTGQHETAAPAQDWLSRYGFNTDTTPKERRDEASTPEAEKWQGWGTALKPAFEPVIVGRKPLIGTVAENVLTHGVGALNIDACRIGDEPMGGGTMPAMSAGDSHVGGNVGAERVENPRQAAGRWPSNVILDPFTAALVDEQSGIRPAGAFPKNATVATGEHYEGGWGAVERDERIVTDSGGASRFFYVAKASKADRNEGLTGLPVAPAGSLNMRTDSHSERTGATTKPAQNFHPTVKPTDLMRQLIRLVTPPGGLVLDPFTGSGSTGKAAILEGFRFIGCELTPDYLPIIEGRLTHAVATVAENAERAARAEQERLF